MITKRSKRTIEFDSKSTAKQRFKNSCFARVHYPVLKPPRTATPSRRHTAGPRHDGHRIAPGKKPGVAIREPKSASIPPRTHRTTGRAKPTTSSTPATPPPSHHATRGAHTVGRTSDCILRRKEVIQPHLPVRLPCYDLVPITSLTLDGSIPQGVRPPASGAAHFHDLTGGVYKARERIHRDVADSRLLATPPSRSRVADCDPN